jgi:hypothetical protein
MLKRRHWTLMNMLHPTIWPLIIKEWITLVVCQYIQTRRQTQTMWMLAYHLHEQNVCVNICLTMKLIQEYPTSNQRKAACIHSQHSIWSNCYAIYKYAFSITTWAKVPKSELIQWVFFWGGGGLWYYRHCGHPWPTVPASGDNEDDYGEHDEM